MAASKDKARAILSYATPNPVGPYRLVTPPTPDLGAGKTKTPVMPVMGGTLVNLPTPVAPTKQTTPVAPPMADKLVNVPKQQGRVVNKSGIDYTDPGPFIEMVPRFPKSLDRNANRNTLDRLGRVNWEYVGDPKLGKHLDQAAKAFSANPNYKDRFDELTVAAADGGRVSKKSQRTAALNMYRDIRDMVSSGVPEEYIPQLATLRGREPLLDPFKGNLDGSRERFTRRYVSGGNVSDRTLYDTIANDLKSLTPAGQETYISLLPGWNGTHKELADAARSLSK